jgi:hypothetical protein
VVECSFHERNADKRRTSQKFHCHSVVRKHLHQLREIGSVGQPQLAERLRENACNSKNVNHYGGDISFSRASRRYYQRNLESSSVPRILSQLVSMFLVVGTGRYSG